MARQPEARLQRRIRKALIREFGGWWVKIWGGPFQRKGTPDILGCVKGRFFAFEAKMPKGRLSDIQRQTIRDIRKQGEGSAHVVFSEEQAIRIVRAHLAKAGVVSKGRGKNVPKTKNRGTVHGTRNRQNLVRWWGDRAIDRAVFHWDHNSKPK